MAQPKSTAAYQDIIDKVLYPALESPKRLTCQDSQSAFALAMRLRSAIKQVRRRNMEIYAAEHPKYGTTDFDNLVISQEGPVVEVRPTSLDTVLSAFNAKMEDIVDL